MPVSHHIIHAVSIVYSCRHKSEVRLGHTQEFVLLGPFSLEPLATKQARHFLLLRRFHGNPSSLLESCLEGYPGVVFFLLPTLRGALERLSLVSLSVHMAPYGLDDEYIHKVKTPYDMFHNAILHRALSRFAFRRFASWLDIRIWNNLNQF
jgi:hypothetical protein